MKDVVISERFLVILLTFYIEKYNLFCQLHKATYGSVIFKFRKYIAEDLFISIHTCMHACKHVYSYIHSVITDYIFLGDPGHQQPLPYPWQPLATIFYL